MPRRITQATNMARAMVTQWGMSDRLGMVQYGDDDEFVFLGREMARAKVYSESVAQQIDGEVKRIIDEAYNIAKNLITTNIDKLELIAKVACSNTQDPGRSAGRRDRAHRQVYSAAPGAARGSASRRSSRHAIALKHRANRRLRSCRVAWERQLRLRCKVSLSSARGLSLSALGQA